MQVVQRRPSDAALVNLNNRRAQWVRKLLDDMAPRDESSDEVLLQTAVRKKPNVRWCPGGEFEEPLDWMLGVTLRKVKEGSKESRTLWQGVLSGCDWARGTPWAAAVVQIVVECTKRTQTPTSYRMKIPHLSFKLRLSAEKESGQRRSRSTGKPGSSAAAALDVNNSSSSSSSSDDDSSDTAPVGRLPPRGSVVRPPTDRSALCDD